MLFTSTESFVVSLMLARSHVELARELTTPRPSEVPVVLDGSGRTPSVSAESVRRLEVDEARFNFCFYYFLLLLMADGNKIYLKVTAVLLRNILANLEMV